MSLSRLKALVLLNECTGADIWSLATCQQKGVPQGWIDELAECYESGFDLDQQTIYVDRRVVNQYHGVHDLLLARKLAAHLGADVQQAAATAWSRQAEVRALKEAVEDL